jgi:hypothetical protein
VDLARYVMERVRADNPDATDAELIDLYAEALRDNGLTAGG